MTTPTQNRNDTADAVIREVRQTKEHLARKFDFDVWRIAVDARARQASSRHEIVSRARPRSQPVQTGDRPPVAP